MKIPPNPPFSKGGKEIPSTEDMSSISQDQYWMQYALELAHTAQSKGEVPVGAVIVRDNQVIGEGHNQPIGSHDPTAHAEIQAIRQATLHDQNYRLTNTTLYVTLEPCAMCAGAIIHARINRVVYGACDPRTGAAGSVFNILQNTSLNHFCEITSLNQESCSHILKSFFKAKREKQAT